LILWHDASTNLTEIEQLLNEAGFSYGIRYIAPDSPKRKEFLILPAVTFRARLVSIEKLRAAAARVKKS
jgi:hypothetical protein